MGKFQDLTGQKFGELTVLERAEDKIYGKGFRHIMWKCKCSCGKEIVLRSDVLKKRTSCGCKNGFHGQRQTRLYGIWTDMKTRCYNKNRLCYKNYGGRGIRICDEWRNNFMSFYKWSKENGYNDELTIDRIDVNGNYCPENCRWATWEVQENNKTTTHYIEYKGETHDISEWAKILGMKPCTLFARINDYHWSVERAFTQPVRKIIK